MAPRRSLPMLALLAACTASGGRVSTDARSSGGPEDGPPPELPALAAVASAPAPAPDWREAARLHDYRRAYGILSALPEARQQPELRLALGRIALLCGEHAAAVAALDGLERDLPALREQIVRWWAEAAAIAGPHEDGARLLDKGAKVLDRIAAAEAYQRAGDRKKARASIDAAVKLASRTRRASDEARAREARARLAEEAGETALALGDLGWIVRTAPGGGRGPRALATLDRLGGRVSLEERLEVLAKSATPENLADTLATLDALAQKFSRDAGRIALARAEALLHARDWAGAHAAFDRAKDAAPGFAAEALYQSGRSAARAGKEEAALERYQELGRRFRSGLWAELGAFRRAELLLSLGRYGEAAEGYGLYLSRFGKGEHVESARYARALAWLSGGEPKKARESLAAMRRKTTDRAFEAELRELEALAALRAGDRTTATRLWLELVREQPLTWPALTAHARLEQAGYDKLPPLMGAPAPEAAPLAVMLPPGPALLQSLGLDDDAESLLAAMEQQAARSFPGRESEALCTMYGLFAGARRQHQVGSRAASLDLLMSAPSARDLWAWQCVYPKPYAELVTAQEQAWALPNGLVYAVMRQESGFKTSAVSPVGALGLMQIMPTTALRAAQEIDLSCPLDEVTRPDFNVKLGAFYLGKLLKSFRGNLPLAVAAYNAGPHAVQQWLSGASDREADLFVARIPYRETRNYVGRVVSNFARYQYLAGGPEAVTRVSLALPDASDIGDDAY